MKLLVVTQKVDIDDDNLGFFHDWLEKFSHSVEQLTVICLEQGRYNLPQNVEVLSLGKERGVSKIGYIFNFYGYIWGYRAQYSHIFVHMNPEYIVLGGLFWRLWGRVISLWYTHKSVNLKLRIAERFTHLIFTASQESFRLESKKVSIVGHGINTDLFKPGNSLKNRLLTIGRLSRSKRIDLLIDIVNLIPDVFLDIVGGAVTADDKNYKKFLEEKVKKFDLEGRIKFVGPVSHKETVNFYQRSSIFINLSETGSLDKVLLEAMSSGLPVISSNDSAKNLKGVKYVSSQKEEVANAISEVLDNSHLDIGREIIIEEHSLDKLIPNLVSRMESF